MRKSLLHCRCITYRHVKFFKRIESHSGVSRNPVLFAGFRHSPTGWKKLHIQFNCFPIQHYPQDGETSPCPYFFPITLLTSPENIRQIYLHLRTRARQIISRFPAPAFYSDYLLATVFSRHFFHTDPIVREVRHAAFSRLEEDFGHGMDHARKVSLDAGTLVIAESGKQSYSDSLVQTRIRLAQCAGLLHDIMRKEKDHAAAGAEYAREVLRNFPFRPDEIEDISQAIGNHEAFKETVPVHTPDGLLISNCLYDADKFRWGSDNFQDTVWDMVIFLQIPFGEFLRRYPVGMEKIAAIRDTFRSDTGKKYGPQFIDAGLAIGAELYAVIQAEFAAFA